MKKNIKIIIYIVLAFWAGYESNEYNFFPINNFLSKNFLGNHNTSKEVKKSKIRGVSVFNNTSSKIEAACPKPENSYIIIGFGQSNSANSAGQRFETNKKILNFFNGKCYIASDPMLGATGNAGSVWIPLAERLKINNKTIVFLTFGIGSSAVAHWLDDNYLLPFYKKNINNLKSIYPAPDAAVWIQGEADVETPINDFKKELSEWIDIVKKDLPKTKLYITGTSYCKGKSNIKVLDVQKKIADLKNAIYVGSTDSLNKSIYRYDNCHFSGKGIEELANILASNWIK